MRGPLLQGPEHCPGGPEAEEPEGGGGEAGAALLWAGGDGAVPAHHTTTLDAQPARQDGSEVTGPFSLDGSGSKFGFEKKDGSESEETAV